MTIVDVSSVPMTVTVSGTGTTRPLGVIPMVMTVSGTMTALFQDGAALHIPLWTISSDAVSLFCSVNIDIPKWTINSLGFADIIGTASDLHIPLWVINAGAPNVYGDTVLYVPTPWIVESTGYTGLVANASIVIPHWTLSMVAWLNMIGTVAIDIPVWIINATGLPLTTINYKMVVMNASHGAITEYNRFNFNSMAYRGDQLITASASGLYAVGANKDDGRDIDAVVLFGVTDMYEKILKRARESWITMRADGDVSLIVKVDEATEYYYPVEHKHGEQHAYESRAKIGRGINSRFIQFGLKNLGGSNFRIESMKVMGDFSNVRRR